MSNQRIDSATELAIDALRPFVSALEGFSADSRLSQKVFSADTRAVYVGDLRAAASIVEGSGERDVYTLKDVLRPFAAVADTYPDEALDDQHLVNIGKACLFLGDFRRAKTATLAIEEAPENNVVSLRIKKLRP